MVWQVIELKKCELTMHDTLANSVMSFGVLAT